LSVCVENVHIGTQGGAEDAREIRAVRDGIDALQARLERLGAEGLDAGLVEEARIIVADLASFGTRRGRCGRFADQVRSALIG
jgi:hypothetical protein